MPLTCGQVVADAAGGGREADPVALERDLADAVALAREEGRPGGARPARPPAAADDASAEALSARRSERAASCPFLAREYASARA